MRVQLWLKSLIRTILARAANRRSLRLKIFHRPAKPVRHLLKEALFLRGFAVIPNNLRTENPVDAGQSASLYGANLPDIIDAADINSSALCQIA